MKARLLLHESINPINPDMILLAWVKKILFQKSMNPITPDIILLAWVKKKLFSLDDR